jgi:cardiolipin synthase (CMP-forming)
MPRRPSITTLANALSFYRLCAAPVIVWAALSEARTLFIVLMLVSLATDAADGFLARRWKQESKLGARLDALADSLTLGAGLTGVWVFERAPFVENPRWLAIFLGALGLATIVSLARFRRLPAFHLYSFKLADLVLTAFFAAVFLYDFLPWAYALSMSLATLAALEIIVVALVVERFRTDLKGIWWVLRARR